MNLECPYLEFVSGSQNSSLSSAKKGTCVSIPSLDTDNSSLEMSAVNFRFLWTGLGLPGTWAGAQSKHATNLSVFDYLLLFDKLHVWNVSTAAWHPTGRKSLCSHTSGKCGNATAAGRNSPLGSLVGLSDSTCTQRKKEVLQDEELCFIVLQ